MSNFILAGLTDRSLSYDEWNTAECSPSSPTWSGRALKEQRALSWRRPRRLALLFQIEQLIERRLWLRPREQKALPEVAPEHSQLRALIGCLDAFGDDSQTYLLQSFTDDAV